MYQYPKHMVHTTAVLKAFVVKELIYVCCAAQSV